MAMTFEPAFPTEVYAGATVCVAPRLSLTAGEGSDARVDILDASGAVRASGFLNRVLTIKVPDEMGSHAWTAVCVSEDGASGGEALATMPLDFVVLSHPTGLAVWGVRSPVAKGERLHAKVGLACRAGCDMHGERFDIFDDGGAQVASGVVGDLPWPGTQGLHWVDVDVPTPLVVGIHTWSVQFTGPQALHESATGSFTFRVDEPPECRVAVKAVRDQSGDPVEDVEVRVGAYTGTTDPTGVAVFFLPRGEFDVSVRKEGLAHEGCSLQVGGDRGLELRLRAAPTYEDLARQLEADLIHHYL